MRRAAPLALALLSLGAAACTTQEVARPDLPATTADLADTGRRMIPTGAPRSGGPTAANVKLQVEIPSRYFLRNQDVTVTVWNPEQMKVRESIGVCSVSVDGSGKEITTCPPGVVFVKPAPETFKVAYSELDGNVVLDLKSLALGERYEVSVSGSASDGCNYTAAQAQGLAQPKIELRDLPYATTEMACMED